MISGMKSVNITNKNKWRKPLENFAFDDVEKDIQEHLSRIEQAHEVTIIAAIESGSRAWGFPSPDSDFDVRFIYAHSKDWYIQLAPERDVIEVPINPVLDISGWDLRKAMNLANGGNAVIQEWLISPIVYRQHDVLAPLLRQRIGSAFSAKATYHHYFSMANGMKDDMSGDEVKLKRFFYFTRATLSAQWINEKQSIPPIEFKLLLAGLTQDQEVSAAFDQLIQAKAQLGEAEVLSVDPVCFEFVMQAFKRLMDSDMDSLAPKQQSLDSDDLRQLLGKLR
mgnify:CR=1 FL=1